MSLLKGDSNPDSASEQVLRFQFSRMNGKQHVTVWYKGETHNADDTHINWTQIIEKLNIGKGDPDPSVAKLFDMGAEFARLSPRLTTRFNQVFYDGDRVDEVFEDHIIDLVREKKETAPTIAFFESLQANPGGGANKQKSADHSRQHLFRYIEKHGLELVESGPDIGQLVVYKGCRDSKDTPIDGCEIVSSHSGDGTVTFPDGKTKDYINTALPQPIGGVVELPRSKVTFDPSQGCAYGLHVGTEHYARTWSGDCKRFLKCHVEARDVVSIPTSNNDQKIRTNRYKIIEEIK